MPKDRTLRLACAGGALLLAVLAYALQGLVDARVQAAAGVMCFLLITAACSTNLRAVNFRTVAWGIGLQLALALFILKFEVAGVRPGYEFFNAVAGLVKRFLEFTNAGSQFVFGDSRTARGGGQGIAERLHLRVHGAADHHLRLVVLHGAVLLRRPAIGRRA